MVQESGLARILLPELGLETVMRINRPAKPGDELQVCVSFIDVPKGIYKFSEAAFGETASLQSADSDDELTSDEDDEVIADTKDAVHGTSAAVVHDTDTIKEQSVQ